MKLTERQQRFADYYIISGNAAQAAREAGYSPKTADRIAHQNLKKVEIVEYIEQHLKERQTENIAAQEEILKFLSDIIRNTKVKTADRLKAAELLGRRYMLWTCNKKHEAELEKTRAEIELLQTRTQLMRGLKKDTGLLEALINTVQNK